MKPILLHIILCAAMILCIGNAALGQSAEDIELVLEDVRATITKTIEDREQISAYLGDILCVKLVVDNRYCGPVLVVDNLNSAFTYMDGSCTLDGVCLKPTVSKNRISFLVEPGCHEITFTVQVVQVEAYNIYINNVAEVLDSESNVDDEDSVIIKLCRYKIHKWLWCYSHDPTALPLGENIVWVMEIYVENTFCFTMKDVVVKDNLAAELEVDSYSPDTVDLEMKTKGKSEKVKWIWTVGDVLPGGVSPTIKFLVSTDLNPAGKQQYTSPGCYELNSGAVVKFKDPLTGNQLSAHTGSVFAHVGTPKKKK